MSQIETFLNDEQWNQLYKENWELIERDWQSEGEEVDPELKEFYWSGDLDTYLDTCEKEGILSSWTYVLQSNPKRDLGLLKSNIEKYWQWLLIAPEERLPNTVEGGKLDAEKYFTKPLLEMLQGNTRILDPNNNLEIFKWIYGESFKSEQVYPVTLGNSNWQPKLKPLAEDFFRALTVKIKHYLFSSKKQAYNLSAPYLVDYWFSIIPHLVDLRVFELEECEDKLPNSRTKVYEIQDCVRGLLAGLHGYDVDYENRTEMPINDLELVNEIKTRLEQTEMPEPYYKLMEFIHKHKENCIYETEM